MCPARRAGPRPKQALKNAHVTIPTSKVTLGQDVDTTLSEVTTGDAEAAIVYVTNAKSVGAQGEGVPIPSSVNVTTSYPIAVVKSTKNKPLAQAWIAFVLSPSAQKVLHQASFLPPLDRGRDLAPVPSMTSPTRGRRPPVFVLAVASLTVAFLAIPLIGLLSKAPWSTLWSDLTNPVAVDALKLSLICSLWATGPFAGAGRPPGLGAGPDPSPRAQPGAGPHHAAHGAAAGRGRRGPAPGLRTRRPPRDGCSTTGSVSS